MNDIHVTLRGNVASELKQMCFDDGNTVTSFRMASNARRYDRDRREWIDKGTTFVRVTCRRAMALNAAESLRKGQPVVVTGRLRERSWSANGRTGQSLEVEAETLGHDLSFGTTRFARSSRVESGQTSESAELAYLLAKDAEREAADRPVDLTGLIVLDDVEGLDQDYEPDPDRDEPADLADRLPDPAVA